MSRPRSRDIFRHTFEIPNASPHIAGRVRRHGGRGMPRPYEEQRSPAGV